MAGQRTKKVAAAAAFGSGGLLGLTAGFAGLLVAEVTLARRAVGQTEALPFPVDGLYSPDGSFTADLIHQSTPLHPDTLRLAVLGDSSAGGIGVDEADETPAVLLAKGLAAAANRDVSLRCTAMVGAQTRDLHEQVVAVAAFRPQIVVALIGANDVTHNVRPSESIRHLRQGVEALRGIDAHVIVGTTPDLGTVRPIQPPLRWLARRLSRALAAAQAIAVVECGGTSVSLGDLLGPEFDRRPHEMFSADRFHPSAAGYRAAVSALLPAVCEAAGIEGWRLLNGEPTESGDGDFEDGKVMPVAEGAVEAADTPGSELVGATVGGSEQGPRGRWVRLRLRTHPTTSSEAAPEGDAANP